MVDEKEREIALYYLRNIADKPLNGTELAQLPAEGLCKLFTIITLERYRNMLF
jgi:hypothetical protein